MRISDCSSYVCSSDLLMSQATGERDYERPATHGRGSMRRPVTVERRAIDLHPDGHDRRRPRHCRRTSERERQGERKTPGCRLERMSGHLHERLGTHSKEAPLAGSPRLLGGGLRGYYNTWKSGG